MRLFYCLLSLALVASAARLSHRRDSVPAAAEDALLLIGGGPSGTIAVATFTEAGFTVVANDTRPGTSASWLLFKQPNLIYAVDENSNFTRLFNVGLSDAAPPASRAPDI